MKASGHISRPLRPLDNQTLRWTGPASSILVKLESVGAVPAIERRSVITWHPTVQTTDVHLRPGTAADADDLVRVHFAAVHGTAPAAYPSHVLDCWAVAPDDGRRRMATRDAIERGEELFVVATLNGVVCGFGSIVPASGELRAVYVDPDFGGRGVGSAILGRLEDWALDRGMCELQMDASINAESFYVKHGYRVVRRGVHRLADGIEMPCVTMSKGIKRQCSGLEPQV